MREYGLIKLGLAAVMLTSASAASEGADVSAGPAYPPTPPPIPFVTAVLLPIISSIFSRPA